MHVKKCCSGRTQEMDFNAQDLQAFYQGFVTYKPIKVTPFHCPPSALSPARHRKTVNRGGPMGSQLSEDSLVINISIRLGSCMSLLTSGVPILVIWDEHLL